LPAGADARQANSAQTYDFAAAESQIEFGEAPIMETNELTERTARKLAAPERLETFRLFRGQ
jgi:hypothetical protein